jgi:hypothetical protein
MREFPAMMIQDVDLEKALLLSGVLTDFNQPEQGLRVYVPRRAGRS